MKHVYEYTYKGVDIVLKIESFDDDPDHRTAGWNVHVDGRHLCCALINNNTVLFLGDRVIDEAEQGTDTVFGIDPGILHAYGRRFEVKPLSTGRGRSAKFDYRALMLMEDPPLEAVHPYVEHMLALREVYARTNVEKAMQELVDDARRQPTSRSKV